MSKKNKRNDLIILENFYKECLRFWERELKVSADEDKTPAIKALEDVRRITTNPNIPYNSPKLDVDTKEYFVRRCEMDIYGIGGQR